MTTPLDRLTAALADRYTIERELGQGGMATVYLARDRKLGRAVALKVLRPEIATSLGGERFLREIEIAAKLAHPHILALHDCGDADGLLYYTMPFVEGESLRDRLTRERQLPLDDALRITREVADALGYAHSRGLVHRDIKPENVLFAAGHAVVADFGIARAVSAAGGAHLTETGLAIGTPAYMSPEQAAGSQDVDGRSDLYSLGCVLYEMLSGETPYTGPTPQAIFAKKLSEPLPRISVVREAVPAGVEAALTKALARTPADRWPTAEDFAAALAMTDAPGHRGTGAPWSPRAGWMVAAGIALLAIAVGVAVIARRPASHRVALDRNAIAVLPFRVSGGSAALRELARGMPDLFWTTVTGEFGIRTADVGLVIGKWRAAGGTLETPMPDSIALTIAQAAGAGRLVVGLVTGTEARLSLSASMLQVPSGRLRVPPITVTGSYDSFPSLADRLIVQLIALDGSAQAHQLPGLSTHPIAAVQAYLRGLRADRFSEKGLWFRRALELDSTFVLAALQLYRQGETDFSVARFAWDHRERLSPRDRLFLRALVGWRFGATRTFAERVAQYDSLVSAAPEWADPLGELAQNLYIYGWIGVPDWRERTMEAYTQLGRLNVVDGAFVDEVGLDLSLFGGDTAAVRRYAKPTLSPSYRLQVALSLGDSATAARLADSLAGKLRAAPEAFWRLLEQLIWLGRGFAGLDRLAEAAPPSASFEEYYRALWARSRGRFAEWREARDRFYASAQRAGFVALGHPVVVAALRVRGVLFLGEPEDSPARDAAAYLEQVARGTLRVPPSAEDPSPDAVMPIRARCWSALWRIRHGDVRGARDVARYLRHEIPLPYRYAVCAGLIELLLAQRTGGDVGAAVRQLDSIVRPGPMEHPSYAPLRRDLTAGTDNLVLARVLAQYGDTAGALAASRRRPHLPSDIQVSVEVKWLLVDFLREEGRLAAISGDRAGAVRAYRHYLSLRTDPDPPWRPQWDSVRAELAAVEARR